MGVISMRALLLYLLLAAVAFARDIAQKEKDASSPRFACPIEDVIFVGHDLDDFKDIGSWVECAHVCNIAADCKFWSWFGSGNHNCYTKDSNEGLQAAEGRSHPPAPVHFFVE